MSDTVKLVIEIPEEDYKYAKQIAPTRNEIVYCERQIIAISNGIPLDDVKTKTTEEDLLFETYVNLGLTEEQAKHIIEVFKKELDDEN